MRWLFLFAFAWCPTGCLEMQLDARARHVLGSGKRSHVSLESKDIGPDGTYYYYCRGHDPGRCVMFACSTDRADACRIVYPLQAVNP
jgi:hypothetical protein